MSMAEDMRVDMRQGCQSQGIREIEKTGRPTERDKSTGSSNRRTYILLGSEKVGGRSLDREKKWEKKGNQKVKEIGVVYKGKFGCDGGVRVFGKMERRRARISSRRQGWSILWNSLKGSQLCGEGMEDRRSMAS
jgi:hypothetical protein